MPKFNIVLILLAFLSLGRLQTIIDIDYQPATEAFTKAKAINDKYEGFKEKVAKKFFLIQFIFNLSITLEFEKCVQQIKENKCNNIDQWQSVIEELKLQIQNSQQIEVPFLQYRKNLKVERLKELIALGEKQGQEFGDQSGKLAEFQGYLKDNAQIIEIMYKLPKKIEEEETSFLQQIDVTEELNSNGQKTKFQLLFLVPDIARDDVRKTTQSYEIGDISIQAQATRNVMDSTMKHVEQTLNKIQEVQNLADTDQIEEKQKLKESIESLRALIANEQWVQAESQTKIDELEGKIAGCQGMPTNIQKDCEPLILKQKKKNAEIDIMKARTKILFNQLKQLMEENEPDSDIQAHVDSIKAQKEAQFKQIVQDSYLKEEAPAQKSTKLAEELHPIHHMREQIQE